ncbi:MAG TPA: sterol desaturase family protein, partial [Paracoccaceae bacterium]|nr:sterol desaturase family protein [Paracoccaceae bacterium]
ILLMDYTLYHWHVLTHRVPLLWRFHLVHHADLDLSATTALRFHFGEMALSVPYRAAQVFLIGTSHRALKTWQNLTIASIVFHHSNVRLPVWLERALVGAVVSPRMHGIHHSVVDEERDSNWSSGLTVWDMLHGTLKLDVPQDAIVVGVPGYLDEGRLTLPRLVALPFRPLEVAPGVEGTALPAPRRPVRPAAT